MAVRVNGKNVLNTTEGAALAQEGAPEAGKAVMHTDTAQGAASDGARTLCIRIQRRARLRRRARAKRP